MLTPQPETQMERVLAQLLAQLTAVAETYEEVNDTDVEEQLEKAVYHGFLIPTPDYQLPTKFAMYSAKGDRAVRKVLAAFLPAARAAAEADGLDTFHKRLAAFQNLDVRVGPQKTCYNDFFRHRVPEWYDEAGRGIGR